MASKRKLKASKVNKGNSDTKWVDTFVEVIRKTSAELPKDVVDVIKKRKASEEPNSRADYAMDIICKNIDIAKTKSQPLCQDTGSVLFYIHYPKRFDYEKIEAWIKKAVVQATRIGYLRQNSVDSLTGKNNGTNLGPGAPSLHLIPWDKDVFDVRLMLKGGGCENVGAQYSLPDGRVGAGRDLNGAKKCILDAVHQAQGKGCGPGVLGVVIGGDRATGYAVSKEQFLRKMGDTNKNKVLAQLEAEVLEDANQLGIGPMGFGGKTTLMGVKIAALNRVPASFFVSVSYMCWAFRRQGAVIDSNSKIKKWLY